jgi:hypothetical protein
MAWKALQVLTYPISENQSLKWICVVSATEVVSISGGPVCRKLDVKVSPYRGIEATFGTSVCDAKCGRFGKQT